MTASVSNVPSGFTQTLLLTESKKLRHAESGLNDSLVTLDYGTIMTSTIHIFNSSEDSQKNQDARKNDDLHLGQ